MAKTSVDRPNWNAVICDLFDCLKIALVGWVKLGKTPPSVYRAV
jgi:hypothetical protein